MAKTSPAEFIRQVRRELNRVVWPTRRETMISTAMVLFLVFIAALFFIITDNVIQLVVRWLLGLGV